MKQCGYNVVFATSTFNGFLNSGQKNAENDKTYYIDNDSLEWIWKDLKLRNDLANDDHRLNHKKDIDEWLNEERINRIEYRKELEEKRLLQIKEQKEKILERVGQRLKAMYDTEYHKHKTVQKAKQNYEYTLKLMGPAAQHAKMDPDKRIVDRDQFEQEY